MPQASSFGCCRLLELALLALLALLLVISIDCCLPPPLVMVDDIEEEVAVDLGEYSRPSEAFEAVSSRPLLALSREKMKKKK